MSDLTEAQDRMMGKFQAACESPEDIESLGLIFEAARKYAALTSPETIDKVAKELKRAALDNLGWSDQARAVLRAVTEDTQ